MGAISAGTGIFSSLLGASGAKSAAKRLGQAAINANNAVDTNTANEQNVNNTNTAAANAGFKPYQDLGTQASGQLQTALANPFSFNLQNDPGYQFRLQQGQQAVNASAAAAGGANSGGTLKALTQYNQGFASTEYQNAFQRNQEQLQNLFQGAGLGLSATNSVSGNLNQNTATNASILGQNSSLVSQNLLTGAGAQAAGTVGATNAITSGVNNLSNTANQAFLYNLLLNNGSTAPTGDAPGSIPDTV